MAVPRRGGAAQGQGADREGAGDRCHDRSPAGRGEALDRGRQHQAPRRGGALRPLRRREVRRPGPLPDRLRPGIRDLRPDRRHALDHPRSPSVDRLQGHRAVRQRRAEGALPARPGDRPQARGIRADRAAGGVRRLPAALASGAPAGRLMGAERGEALHRQRLEGRRLHRVRPCRGRRQGPPHRTDPREGDEGLRGRRALRHDGPARQRPAAALFQRRPGAARERPRRAR